MLPAFVATILYTARSFFSKKLLSDKYSGVHVVWGMRAYGLIFIPILAILQRAPLIDCASMSEMDWMLLSIGVLSGLLAMFTSYYSLSKWDLSETVPLSTIGPVITAFLAYMILGEKLTVYGFLGVAVVLSSIFALQFFENGISSRSLLRTFASPQLIIMFFTAFLFSISGIVYKGVSDSISSITYMLITYLVNIIANSVILVFVEKKTVKELLHFDPGMLFLSIIAVLAIYFNTWAYRVELAAFVSSVQQIEVLLLIIVGFLFLNERRNLKIRLATGSLAVLGISVMTLFG